MGLMLYRAMAGKLRVATTAEKDVIMKNGGKRTCGMYPSKLVNKTDSSNEIIVRK